MRRRILALVLSVTGYWLLVTGCCAQENVTVTTYYPSPVGSYRDLRSQRMAIGNNYNNPAQFCWGALCGPNVIPNDASLIVEGNVGIGISDVHNRVHILGFSRGNPNIDNTMVIEAMPIASATGGSDPGISFDRRGVGGGVAPFGALGLSGHAGGWTFGSLANDFVLTTGNGSLGRLLLGTNDPNTGISSARVAITDRGNVGIGTLSPQARLDLVDSSNNGAIRIGNTGVACDATRQGTVRYNGGVMEYCNGTSWAPIAAAMTQSIITCSTQLGDYGFTSNPDATCPAGTTLRFYAETGHATHGNDWNDDQYCKTSVSQNGNGIRCNIQNISIEGCGGQGIGVCW